MLVVLLLCYDAAMVTLVAAAILRERWDRRPLGPRRRDRAADVTAAGPGVAPALIAEDAEPTSRHVSAVLLGLVLDGALRLTWRQDRHRRPLTVARRPGWRPSTTRSSLEQDLLSKVDLPPYAAWQSIHRIRAELSNRRWTRGGGSRRSGFRSWAGEFAMIAISGACPAIMVWASPRDFTPAERWLVASASCLSIMVIGAFFLSHEALPNLTRAGRRMADDVEAVRKDLATRDLPAAGDPFELLARHGRDYAWAVGFGLLPDPLRHRYERTVD